MQPDEGAWQDATKPEQAILDRIRERPVTIGEPVQHAGRWAVAAFSTQDPNVSHLGLGTTRLGALTDLEASFIDGAPTKVWPFDEE